ncbi:hypothetical protein [Clostridium sp. C2-6-12]|uniref:hypothetical protein n=1 Tax=Clostridium sp. C2-6-12 TaxID=2698832 RepID=UPI00136CA120|nr:hypothetical protein [Clostridium sp. C2-6-12]
MADSRIKGITIELDGETTGLQKALSDVTKQSIDIQKELRDVDRLLKFDPSNIEAMAQRQKLLASQIEVTSEKLNRLKSAEQQVNEQFEKGAIGETQFRAFRREIEYTEGSLNKLKQSLSKVDDAASLKEVKIDLSKIPEEAENAEESIKGLGGELTGILAGAVAAGGIHEVIEKALDVGSLNTKINVSMDVSEESIDSIKDVIITIQAYGLDGEAALEGVRRQWALNKDASDETNAAVVKGAATIAAAYSGVDFTELIQEVNEVSKSLGITNEEALALTNSLLKAGFPPEQLDIISEYGTQLKMAGYNVEEIQALFAAGVDTGTWNIDNLMDGLKEGRIKVAEFGQGISNSMTALLNGTNISANQMREWGKAVAAGGEGDSKAMNEIAAALNQVDDQTKKNALGVAIFGTKYEDQGQAIIDTLLNAKNVTIDLEASQEELNNTTAQLKADPVIAMKQAMADLTLALTPLLLQIAGIISVIASWISNNSTLAAIIAAISTAIGILVGLCAALAPIFSALSTIAEVLGVGLGVIAGTVGVIVTAIAALIVIGALLYKNWDEISAKAIEIWSFLKEWIPQALQQISAIAISVLSSMKEFFSQIWEDIKSNSIEIWNSTVLFFTQSIPEWINKIGEWFLKLPNKIAYALGFALGTIIQWGIDAWNYLSTNVPVWIENIGVFFSELPEIIWTWLINVLTNFVKWSGNIISWIATNVPAWINNIVSYFTSLPEAIWSWLVQVVSNITTWGSNMLTEAVKGAQQVFDGVINTFANLPSKMLEIGTNIVEGIKQGISDAWEGMTGWIGDLCDDFIDGVKETLDIHSPSRVMMKLGVYTGEGFGLGIKSTIGQISRQAEAMANAAIPNVDTSSAVASLSGSKVAGTGINQTVNIYSPVALSPAETAKQNKRVLQELALGF